MQDTIARKPSMVLKSVFSNSADFLKAFFSIQPATIYHISEKAVV